MFGVKIAVTASALSDDPREAAGLARRAGFAGIVLEARGRAMDITELSSSGRRELTRALAAQDQQLAAVRFNVDAQALAGGHLEQVLERFDRVLEAAAGLKALCLCSNLGPLPSLPAALAELGNLCDRYGVVIAMGSSLPDFAALHQALTRAGCPWFGVDLDPLALSMDEWDMDEFFARLGPLIRHVRARDGVPGADGRVRPVELGKGAANFEQLLGHLISAEYRGWIEVEERGAAGQLRPMLNPRP